MKCISVVRPISRSPLKQRSKISGQVSRSFRLNFEITAIVAEPEFIEQMEKMFEADFEKSRLMRAGEYDDKPFWFRFAVRLSSLTAPIQ